MFHTSRRAPTVMAAAFVLFPPSASVAFVHDAKSGWSYPFSCCSGFDCREVSESRVSQSQRGYVIANTGEVVGYSDERLRDSPDGKYHWCSVAGADDGDTICLFVPPKLF